MRRRQILDTAREILLSDGWSKLSMRDVAARLGMTHGNLQYYFPTREDLLIGLYDEEVKKYTLGLREAMSQASTLRGRLDAIVDSALEQIVAPETRLWQTAVAESSHSEEIAAVLRRENALYQAAVADELSVIAPDLTPQRRRHLSQLIQALIDGVAAQVAADEPDSPAMRSLFRELKAAVATLVEYG